MRTIHTEKYYPAMKRLKQVYDRDSRKLAFGARTIVEFEEWKKIVRQTLLQITGVYKMESSDLMPQLLKSEYLDGYRRDKIRVQTEPDVWMPFYVLVSDGLKEGEKRPAMICPHGHGSGGKYTVVGRSDIPAAKDTIVLHNYDYGLRFVREGYIVFCPDARGFGERREWMGQGDDEGQFLHSTCHALNHMAICLGMSLTGMFEGGHLWNGEKTYDFVKKALSEQDNLLSVM